jgi:flagellar protein FlbD
MGHRMIFVTRLDGREVVVNADLVVTIEKTPDTVLTLTTGDRIMVRESVEEVVQRAVAYRHRLMQGPGGRDAFTDLAASLRAGDGSARTPHPPSPASGRGDAIGTPHPPSPASGRGDAIGTPHPPSPASGRGDTKAED